MRPADGKRVTDAGGIAPRTGAPALHTTGVEPLMRYICKRVLHRQLLKPCQSQLFVTQEAGKHALRQEFGLRFALRFPMSERPIATRSVSARDATTDAAIKQGECNTGNRKTRIASGIRLKACASFPDIQMTDRNTVSQCGRCRDNNQRRKTAFIRFLTGRRSVRFRVTLQGRRCQTVHAKGLYRKEGRAAKLFSNLPLQFSYDILDAGA